MNRHSNIRRMVSLVLCLMLMLCTAATAHADTTAYAKGKADVYVEKNGSPKRAGSVPAGTQVTVRDVKGSWALVEKDGKQAYMKKADLTTEKQASATPAPEQSADKATKCNKKVYVAVDGAKAYASASASSDVVGTLALGDRLTMTAYTDDWCMVKNGSRTAYMKRSELSLNPVEPSITATPSATATPDPAQGSQVVKCNKKVYVAVDGATVYESASTRAKSLGTMQLGDSLTMTAYTDDWCMVKNDGKTGYIRRGDVSLTKVEATASPEPTDDVVTCDKTGYAKEDGVKVFARASTGTSVLATLSKNDSVRVTAISGDWCQVKNGSATGYVQKAQLSDEKISDMPSELKYGDSGESVKQLQQRLKDLGYFDGTVAGNYLDATKKAVALFQSQNDLGIDGNADSNTLKKLFSDSAKKYDPTKVPEATEKPAQSNGESTATPASGHSVEMDWWISDIQKIFARGTTAVVTDVSTGISWKERRTGGTNHADCQPVTEADTAAMKKACGKWSWERRAIWVSIGGQKYAASMNCMPHGSGSITTNNFDGHHCIHFTNSRTHGSNQVCPLHQAAIKKAVSKG